MKGLFTRTLSNLLKLPMLQVIPIIIVHVILTNYVRMGSYDNIYTFLVRIPLNTGCSYMIFKALLKDKISVVGMFEGRKFCKKTRTVFVGTCIVQELLMLLIVKCSQNMPLGDITTLLIWLHSAIFYVINYRVSFMRYYSMEGYYYDKPLSFIKTVKGSIATSKNTTVLYVVTHMFLMLLGVMVYFLFVSKLSIVSNQVYSFVYIICTRVFDESLRISIFQLNRLNFHEEEESKVP